MDLWIRSQDRMTLMRLRRIDVQDCYIICYEDDGYDDHIVYMGKYETEDRALEVLDEIVSYKDKLDEANFLGMTESIFVSSIYTMPKE